MNYDMSVDVFHFQMDTIQHEQTLNESLLKLRFDKNLNIIEENQIVYESVVNSIKNFTINIFKSIVDFIKKIIRRLTNIGPDLRKKKMKKLSKEKYGSGSITTYTFRKGVNYAENQCDEFKNSVSDVLIKISSINRSIQMMVSKLVVDGFMDAIRKDIEFENIEDFYTSLIKKFKFNQIKPDDKDFQTSFANEFIKDIISIETFGPDNEDIDINYVDMSSLFDNMYKFSIDKAKDALKKTEKLIKYLDKEATLGGRTIDTDVIKPEYIDELKKYIKTYGSIITAFLSINTLIISKYNSIMKKMDDLMFDEDVFLI